MTFCIGGRGFALVCLVTARFGEADRLPTFSTATLEEATGSAVDELAVGGVAITQATEPRNTAEATGPARAREPHPARDPRGLVIITLPESAFIAGFMMVVILLFTVVILLFTLSDIARAGSAGSRMRLG